MMLACLTVTAPPAPGRTPQGHLILSNAAFDFPSHTLHAAQGISNLASFPSLPHMHKKVNEAKFIVFRACEEGLGMRL